MSTETPIYCVPNEVQNSYSSAISLDSNNQPTIGDGKNFQNNGDIMIATESLSKEAYESIRDQKLYLQSTLEYKKINKLQLAKTHAISAINLSTKDGKQLKQYQEFLNTLKTNH